MAQHAHTVRITERTHQTLTELKRSTGRSMPALIEQAVERWEREHLLREANADWAEIIADPAASAEIEAERALWDATVADGLEAEEWRDDAVQPAETGLSSAGAIMCEQPRVIARQRLLNQRAAGRLDAAVMDRVDRLLKAVLDLP